MAEGVPKQDSVFIPKSIFDYWNHLNKLFPQMNLVMGIGLGKEILTEFDVDSVIANNFLLPKELVEELTDSMTAVHKAYGMPEFLNERILEKSRVEKLFPYNIGMLKTIVGKMKLYFEEKGNNPNEEIPRIYRVAGEIINTDQQLKRLGIKLKSEEKKLFAYINDYCEKNNIEKPTYDSVMPEINHDKRYKEIKDRIIVIKKTIFNYLMRQTHAKLSELGFTIDIIDLKKFFS